MRRIVTVTLNPAIDKTIRLPHFAPGRVNRVTETRSDPGGKGINVARVLKQWGENPLALGWVGGHRGQSLLERLDTRGIDHQFAKVKGETRTNLKMVEEDTGRVTDLNEPGFRVFDEDVEHLLEIYEAALREAEVIVLAGSLPPGAPSDFYGTLINRARKQNVKVFLDADGSPLKEGIARIPYAVKPNLAELERCLGRRLPQDADRVAAGKELLDRGIHLVALSQGAEGAWFFTEKEAIRAIPPDVSVSNPVGAGDTMVAALAVGACRGWSLNETIRFSIAAGSVTASKEGTQFSTDDEARSLADHVNLSSRTLEQDHESKERLS
ncbi:1-phosphofructokinase [Paludifilum halophilum]|uniref:Tagatose-6-phosphate kinase n=1 Tax=Paludifilum halophilum TaxID=1642702 RepID=A0A235B9U6_9BACL|nr:1-phosphofructokinase [Paludifilum halophilum]OYD09064.1 1-phosphofructokinase [Paludifilum halophilum]